MALNSLVGRVLIGLHFLVSLTFISADKLELDFNSQETKEWFDISCFYLDDPIDFTNYGCPVDFRPDEENYPQKRGYWGPCGASQCEIHYYGGNRVPNPKSITLSTYAIGNPQLSITSKYGILDTEFTEVVGGISYNDVHGWYETTIDTSKDSRAMVLKFTLATSRADTLILDKIIIDIGENGSFPTERAPTTTPIPLNGDEINLDKDNEYWVLWNQDCDYSEDYNDLWVYGCPENPTGGDAGNRRSTGFWSSCRKTKCTLQYVANPVMAQPIPATITIDGYLKGNGSVIDVSLKTNPLDFNCSNCIHIDSMTALANGDGQWVQKVIQVGNVLSKNIMINITLIPEDNGVVLIDQIRLKLKSQDRPDGGKDGDNMGSGNIFKMEWATLVLSLAMSIISIMRLRY